MSTADNRFAPTRPFIRPTRLAQLAGAAVLVAHGAIHAMGVALLWELGEPGTLTYAEANPTPGTGAAIVVGALWALAGLLLILSGVMLAMGRREWVDLATAGAAVSVPAILPMIGQAPLGAAASGAILVVGVALLRAGHRHETPGHPRPVRIPSAIAADWAALGATDVTVTRFEPGLTEALPAPVRRWLTHAIAPGTPLASAVELRTRGEIKTGRWMRYRARQILAPPAGMVWAASTGLGPIRITGFDRYLNGKGEMCWKFLGLIPLLRVTGPATDRSSVGRLAGEALLNPALALAPWVAWEEVDHTHAIAHVSIGDMICPVTIEVAVDGRLVGCTLPRSGGPGKDPDRERAFHVAFDNEEVAFDGFTIPAHFTAGWDWDGARWADGPFFRADVDRARFH
jgi:hypothetical protein